ncbi:hypothetical protein FOB58_003328 [Candida parapsilosis]|uniref:Golgi to ER traffic protein 4 n=2 Tax=Candida parapsilosis TaxID=5480 RepID=G8B6C1_CANPC|nr:uncharacterized protein CPAR2_100410 [Candida parapsilosis]KAF6047982.1 hypothetical protein FOB59_003025 [Candida parapsilosis]KAF6050051.1 hypothetical protein FOB58_003328 [Candida parapsilosis]KAF6057914.1 hypothetical protein FOB60_002469 [Candida parapsilosis]KAF6065379.1 hypothetical protein FOB61_001449 [Candida parapsilosis]KAI5903766.1 Golgi to ER traffic protein 4 [Candida parapsilosis]
MSDKLTKTIQRFQSKIDAGSFYEAHQTLRTITNRYVKAKQYSEARDLLYQGADILIKNKEHASASDLILYLIQVYEEEGLKVTDREAKLKLIDLISSLPNNDPSLNDLAKASITWSQKSQGCEKFGDNELHHLFGSKLIQVVEEDNIDYEQKAKIFAVAELHLVLGTFESVPIYVNFLVATAKANSNTDAGALLARPVLNYAYLKNIKFVKEAQTLFLRGIDAESEKVGDIDYYSNYPLLNFVQLLVEVLQKDPQTNSQKFRKLYDHYKSVLKDGELLAPVEYLGKFYFNLNIGNSNNQGGLMANLMSGLFK